MNGKQRINAALSGVMPDTTPVMLHNFLMAIRENGYTVEQYRNSPRIITDVFCSMVDRYGVDGILLEMDTALLASCAGAKVDYPEDGPAHVTGIQLESIADIGKLKPVDFSKTRGMIVLEAAERIVDRIGKDIFIRGNCDQSAFSLAGLLRGTQNFLMDLLLEDESAVFALLDYAHNVADQFLQLMAKTGVDMVSNGDSPAGPAMVSPDMYRKFAWKYEKALSDRAHSLNLPHMMHICGDTTAILDDMVATGADSLELDYKTDIDAINRSLKGKCTFCGNVDPSAVLCFGSVEEVERTTTELLMLERGNPRFILNAGCAIPAITPEKNIRTFVNTARRFAG